MRANIATVCLARLDALGAAPAARTLAGMLAHGTSEQARQANLYLMMRTYRLVREFMLGLVAQKLQSRDTVLSRTEVTSFLEDLRHRAPEVGAWSDATLVKTRQVLMRCLSEAGAIGALKSSQKEYSLRALLLDGDVEHAIRDNGDAALLPAFKGGA